MSFRGSWVCTRNYQTSAFSALLLPSRVLPQQTVEGCPGKYSLLPSTALPSQDLWFLQWLLHAPLLIRSIQLTTGLLGPTLAFDTIPEDTNAEVCMQADGGAPEAVCSRSQSFLGFFLSSKATDSISSSKVPFVHSLWARGRRGHGSVGAGVAGSCEPPAVGAGSSAQALRNSMGS